MGKARDKNKKGGWRRTRFPRLHRAFSALRKALRMEEAPTDDPDDGWFKSAAEASNSGYGLGLPGSGPFELDLNWDLLTPWRKR